MSKIAASLPTAPLKSQIAIMSGKVAASVPQSELARFIFADLKGGEAKHDFAMSVVTRAIEQAYKGNTRDIPEATKLCAGKAIKSKAYLAGFHAVADMVAPVKYVGKLADAANATVRETIAEQTRITASEFEKAFLMAIVDAKAQSLDKKAEKAASGKVAAPAPTVLADALTAAQSHEQLATVDAVVIDIATSVDAVVQAITNRLLDPAELEMIRLALYMLDTPVAPIDATTAFNAAMTSAESTRALLAEHDATVAHA